MVLYFQFVNKEFDLKKAPDSYLDHKRPPISEALRLEVADGNSGEAAIKALISKGYHTPRPRPWKLGYRDRGLGRGDFAILDRFDDLVAEVQNPSDAEFIVSAVNKFTKDHESFKRDFEEWKRETAFLSSQQQKEHPAYKRIIARGLTAIPHIIHELRENPSWILSALSEITGAHPSPPEHAGKLRELTQDWLLWAAQEGY